MIGITSFPNFYSHYISNGDFLKRIFFLLLININLIVGQTNTVIESNENHFIFEIDFTNVFNFEKAVVNGIKFDKISGRASYTGTEGEPMLPAYYVQLGIPFNSSPSIQIIHTDKTIIKNRFILPVFNLPLDSLKRDTVLQFSERVYSSNEYFPSKESLIENIIIARFARLLNIKISPYQFNPVTKEVVFNRKLRIRVDYNSDPLISSGYRYVKDKSTENYLYKNVLNTETALKWIGQKYDENKRNIHEEFWYNPLKEYYKIYIKEKGVYRITFEDLELAGYDGFSVDKNKIEMFANEKQIPVDLYDVDNDGKFGPGDYLQFVGYPSPASPYCKQNIYTDTNIYWLTADGDGEGLFYNDVDGSPVDYDTVFTANYRTIHYEEDKIFERLGYAANANRDYWFWGKSYGSEGEAGNFFTGQFPVPDRLEQNWESINIRVNLHGITTGHHEAEIMITSQPFGKIEWTGQESATFEKSLEAGSIGIYNENNLQVIVKGMPPPFESSDEIRINWFEIDYWQENRVDGNFFYISSPPAYEGRARFQLWSWKSDNQKIYIPQKFEIIRNPQITNNQWEETNFAYTINDRLDFFIVSGEYYLTPDSIKTNNNSDLRNRINGADYIIITHPDFLSEAEKLASYRSDNLEGYNNPRIKVVNIFDIYNEFSGGLLEPEAVRNFISYAYQNYEQPAPAYVSLLGDMSWDYRKVLPNSRNNYIPSIAYHSIQYGLAMSDNMLVAVDGEDVVPDLAIGRISCETKEEAEILVNKIINYPDDNSKEWKQNILLIGAGENYKDEQSLKFNDRSVDLDTMYINQAGYTTIKIFNYPSKPEHLQFYGSTYEIREGFNSGSVIANFYGHGGGYQWDQVFLNDDIYLLQNGGRLPVITSITCYTAHFDNQNVFGEQFNKVPEKGAIGFWGHTGITFFFYGVEMNMKFYDQIFSNGIHVIGDAIRYAKMSGSNNLSQLTKDHIALLTYLGDPALELALPKKPDFYINEGSISVNPQNPVAGEQIEVKIIIRNLGSVFPGDSVSVELFEMRDEEKILLGLQKLNSFGETDSLLFKFTPDGDGSKTLLVEVNSVDAIDEIDYSDNSAVKTVFIYDLTSPNIIKPVDASTADDQIKFVLADAGEYAGRELQYVVQLSERPDFSSILFEKLNLRAKDGLVVWQLNQLAEGKYFWRAKIVDGQNSSDWSEIRTFTIKSNKEENNFSSSEIQLKLFSSDNLYYDYSFNALILNKELLPPKPAAGRILDEKIIEKPADVVNLTLMTTDGTYLYIGHMAFYGGPTKIYKFGTGFNETEFGINYGVISNHSISVLHQIFYYNNAIYAATEKSHELKKIDLSSGDTSTVFINDGLIKDQSGKVEDGAFYLTSDGKYIYNLSYLDSTGNYKYTQRTLDPSNNWSMVTEDKILGGTSYPGFANFFTDGKFIYPFENYNSGYMRRIEITTGLFDEEWVTATLPHFRFYYAWAYDKINDVVYATQKPDTARIVKFVGSYFQSDGKAVSQKIGPAVNWDSANYEILNKGEDTNIKVDVLGLDSQSGKWTNVIENADSTCDLTNIDANNFRYLQFEFNIADTAAGSQLPPAIKSLNVNYTPPPEIVVNKNSIIFHADSLLQGFPVTADFKILNAGISTADSVDVEFFINDDTNPVKKHSFKIEADSVKNFVFDINTSVLRDMNKLKAKVNYKGFEFYDFNNTSENDFYVASDSIRPELNITFDGIEIFDDEIVSSKPDIQINLKDNSALPIDTSDFNIYLDFEKIYMNTNNISFIYEEYPSATARLTWSPVFESGLHYLEIEAKDASGNNTDTVSYQIRFNVSTENRILDVYNYPNPFENETYFTFNLTGSDLPDELKIRIFTVAGRLIREIFIPPSDLRFGFNKIYWDGRDQDGENIANGVYFYKISVVNNGQLLSETKKMAKLK